MSFKLNEKNKVCLGETELTAKRCFPWSHPENYFSLRDHEGKEHLMIDSGDSLTEQQRNTLTTALTEDHFCLIIKGVYQLDEGVQLRTWEIETHLGPRTFQSPSETWLSKMPDGNWGIRDLYGDLYVIEVPITLDELSKKKLWALLDL